LGYKINYPVPNFGVDTDIIDNHASLATAEAMKSHKLEMGTDASKAKWHNPAKDVDYNFAPKLDGDIITTNKNLADTEMNLGHHWALAVQLDSDVDQGSDPICSSAGCTQYKHKKKPLGYKINYPVPNFGVDTDIIDNHASLELAEGMKSHKLALGTEASKARWHNPAKDVDYNFAPKLDGDIITTNKNLADTETNLGHHWALAVQLDSDIKADAELEAKTESDPICSSAGCTQYQHKKKGLGYKINYSVPNFGRDHDINDNFASIKLAEGMVGHEFQIGTAASKEKWANKAKDTDYDFNPALDEDVIATRSNLNLAEGQLGHKWTIA